MTGDWLPPSPKTKPDGRVGWHSYYAAYSSAFVESALSHLELPARARVVDPWNGSGTTTSVGASLGYEVIGYDANPVLVLVARGRLLDRDVRPSIVALAEDIAAHARDISIEDDDNDEPLELWFDRATARRVRSLEMALQHTLVQHGRHVPLAVQGLDGVSQLASFFYLSLFDALRALLSRFRTTNPTWLKAPASTEERAVVPQERLEVTWKTAVVDQTTYLARRDTADVTATVRLADSRKLPLSDQCSDAVVTSPPYLTRIDYVIATRPELALLGYDDEGLRRLRAVMIGTPTMTQLDEVRPDIGEQAAELVRAVSSHPSRASSTYYYQYFLQYLLGMAASIVELRRVARPHTPIVIVAQDSYYKDIHVDLPSILAEMIQSAGWVDLDRKDYHRPVTKAAVNHRTRKYRSTFAATESIIVGR